MAETADNACRESVRSQDMDLFLATLFAPEVAQPHLFALQAFAAELARIPFLVSEPQIGDIRLQWWADTLDQFAAGSDPGHPVAQALAATVQAHELPLQPLQAMIEARRFDLYADTMPDLTALEAYFGETDAALMQLSCLILDRPSAARAAEAAGFAGVAFGLARSLVMSRTPEKLVPQGHAKDDLLELAAKRLGQARGALAALPRSLLPAFLPVSLAELYLAASRRNGRSVPQWRRQWRLWRASRSERF